MARLHGWFALALAVLWLPGCAVDPGSARAFCVKDGEKCSKAQCAAAGGTIHYEPHLTGVLSRYCSIPAHDAGKACRDSGECESRCLAPPQGTVGQPVTGMCGEYANGDYECSALVANGVIREARVCPVE
jgi:hypothetical protein